jgi:hypothetical protein
VRIYQSYAISIVSQSTFAFTPAQYRGYSFYPMSWRGRRLERVPEPEETSRGLLASRLKAGMALQEGGMRIIAGFSP